MDTEQAIQEAAENSKEDNWDGEGAKAYNRTSYKMAMDLIKVLPSCIPEPDVGVDPEGMFEFEWYIEPVRVFSITMGSNQTLIYSGLFYSLTYSGLFDKEDRSYGVVNFEGELPEIIIECLQRLYPGNNKNRGGKEMTKELTKEVKNR